jgi:hypothetical protein
MKVREHAAWAMSEEGASHALSSRPGASRRAVFRFVVHVVAVSAAVSCANDRAITNAAYVLNGVDGALLDDTAQPRAPALPEQDLPARLLTLDFADPLLGYEANSKVWYSLTQALGGVNDTLGVRKGWDEKLWGRGLLAAFALYSSSFLRDYSHEIAHDYVVREHGLFDGFHVDLGDWSRGWPRYEKATIGDDAAYYALPDDELIKSYVDGLDQEEFNTATEWTRCHLMRTNDVVGGMAFLRSKLHDVYYVLLVGTQDARPMWTGNSVAGVNEFARENGLLNDLDMYTLHLFNRGIDLKKRDYLAQVLVADLLSWHTWESAAVVVRYLRTGERTRVPSAWGFSNGHSLTPPLVSCYLTPLGTFYDIQAFLDPAGPHPVLLSFGTDVDFIGDGRVDRTRLGARYHGLTAGRLRLDPFAYVNLSGWDGWEGVSVGAEGYVRLTPKVDLRFKLEYSESDVVENTVKGKDEGFGLTVGLEARY